MAKKPLTVSEMAKMGGHARKAKLSKEQLSKIGKAAAAKRWAKKPGEKGGK
jgi:hypothetical protein